MACAAEETITNEELDGLNADIQTIDNVVELTDDQTVTKSGADIYTLRGQLKRLGYEPPVTYTGGISFGINDNVKTIDRNGIVYAPLPSELPFTTSGTWGGDDEDKFFVIQSFADFVDEADISQLQDDTLTRDHILHSKNLTTNDDVKGDVGQILDLVEAEVNGVDSNFDGGVDSVAYGKSSDGNKIYGSDLQTFKQQFGKPIINDVQTPDGNSTWVFANGAGETFNSTLQDLQGLLGAGITTNIVEPGTTQHTFAQTGVWETVDLSTIGGVASRWCEVTFIMPGGTSNSTVYHRNDGSQLNPGDATEIGTVTGNSIGSIHTRRVLLDSAGQISLNSTRILTITLVVVSVSD